MKKILCLGDVALDVIAQLKEPINYGNDTASRISTHPGGQAANVATWITRTNNRSVLVARVGNDPVGFALVSDLDKYGVEHKGLMNSGRPSGVVVILVDSNGERTMFPDNGANADLEVIWLCALRFSFT
jgi:sugar/nucleoside kinase (ribokinase family)